MPDWSYRTVLRPVMMAMGAERARRVAVATLRMLGRVPGGLRFIDFLGHMRADPRLRLRAGGVELAGPLAIGALIDPRGDALPAFSRFGAALVELGPVVEEGGGEQPEWRIDLRRRTIEAASPVVVDVETVARNLEAAALHAAVCVRIAKQDRAAVQRIIERLRRHAAAFVLAPENVDAAVASLSERREPARPLVLSADEIHERADGVWVRFSEMSARSAGAVRELRAELPPEAVIVAAGATEPCEAKELLDAGANLVAVDAGLVCSGPALVKRCNEALLSSACGDGGVASDPSDNELARPALPAAREAWFWALMMGIAMFAGGVMALAIGSTRVVLPYDESLSGLTRAEMAALNERLLPFMAHDRISLAGTMLSIGIFYAALAWYGIRHGAHWAHVTVVSSATAGFLTFFTFLGFGYFDPFHAFVTAIVTQFLLLCLVARPSPAEPVAAEWRETAVWRRGQWGQLLFILLGIGLTGAGLVITSIGVTRVFVESDLEFMRTTAAQLRQSYEHLVPLIAHDRATLGGMLIANGITVWLAAQWGFRAGARWLWVALAWGGNIAFVSALAVHLVVGYQEPLHLAPAILGCVLWNLALALTSGWMRRAPVALE